MRTTPVALVALAAVGCLQLTGDDVPGTGGSPEYVGGSNAEGGGGPDERHSLEEPAPPGLEPVALDKACGDSADLETVITAAPRSRAGFASAQYAAASLARGAWPDAEALRLDDFIGYYADRLPVSSDDPFEARTRLVLLDADNAQLDVVVRVRASEADTPPVHIIAVVDVSESAGSLSATRDGALDALASAIDARARGDSLSVVAFGAPPVVVMERAVAGDVRDALLQAKAGLVTRPGDDLIGALHLAQAMAHDGANHVLVLTDGGTSWHDHLANALAEARKGGIVTSIAQVGKSDGTLFLHDDLLAKVAAHGDGTRLYLADGGNAEPSGHVFATRFDDVFSIGLPAATIELTTPPGITTVGGDPAEQGTVAGIPVGLGRPVGATFNLTTECESAFESNALAKVALVSGETRLEAYFSLVGIAAGNLEPGSASLMAGIEAYLVGLRTRSHADLRAAHVLLKEITGPQCLGGELCVVADEIAQSLGQACVIAGFTSACE